MRSVLAALLTVVAFAAHAELESSPTEYYSMGNLMTDASNVKMQIVPRAQVNQICQETSRQLGNAGFSTPVEGCSFWIVYQQKHYCHIIVGDRTNNDILGHEFRHCIQGAFH